jgi:hypothetical protein
VCDKLAGQKGVDVFIVGDDGKPVRLDHLVDQEVQRLLGVGPCMEPERSTMAARLRGSRLPGLWLGAVSWMSRLTVPPNAGMRALSSRVVNVRVWVMGTASIAWDGLSVARGGDSSLSAGPRTGRLTWATPGGRGTPGGAGPSWRLRLAGRRPDTRWRQTETLRPCLANVV